jgi:hypothetical protein
MIISRLMCGHFKSWNSTQSVIKKNSLENSTEKLVLTPFIWKIYLLFGIQKIKINFPQLKPTQEMIILHLAYQKKRKPMSDFTYIILFGNVMLNIYCLCADQMRVSDTFYTQTMLLLFLTSMGCFRSHSQWRCEWT